MRTMVSEIELREPIRADGSKGVYRGVFRSTGRAVIIKVSPERGDLETEMALLREARSEHLVEPLGIENTEAGPGLVFADLGLRGVQNLLAEGPLSIEQSLKVALGAANALAALHRERIVHRDIKPDNLVADPACDRVLLIDLGYAARIPLAESGLPRCGLVGTLEYISPEQTGRTALPVDTRSDLYSLGVTLYQLLSGNLPYAGGDTMALLSSHLSAPIPEVHLVARWVPKPLSRVIARLMSKSPEERYQTAEGLKADLERCLHEYRVKGSIESFELGGDDPPPLKWPAEVPGYESAERELRAALEDGASGRPRLVLIQGVEGVEKEAWAYAAIERVSTKKFVGTGQYDRDSAIPMQALGRALESIAQTMLAASDEEHATLRVALLRQLGGIGAVLLELVPTFSQIIGPQPKLPELGAKETKTRFETAIARTIRALGECGVCVLCLGHAERVDPATIGLLAELTATPGLRLVVLACCASPPYAFDGLNHQRIALGPLPVESVLEVLSHALDTERESLVAFAEIVTERTHGYLRSIRDFVTSLIAKRIVRRRHGEWRVDLGLVQSTELPASASELLASRMRSLEDRERSILRMLSVEAPLDLDQIARYATISLEEAAESVERLVHLGLVGDSDLRFSPSSPQIGVAIREQSSSSELKALHRLIGVDQLRTLDSNARQERAFDLLRHLELGRPQLDREQGSAVSQLALWAASKAFSMAAFEAAERIAKQGIESSGGHTERALTHDLRMVHSRSLAALGHHDDADALMELRCGEQLAPSEIAELYAARIDLQMSLSNAERGVALGREALARLGVRVPRTATLMHLVPRLLWNHRRIMALGDDLERLGECTNDVALAQIETCCAIFPAAFQHDRSLFGYLIQLALSITLRHGLTQASSFLLASHSIVVHGALGKLEEAYDVARRALEFHERRPSRRFDAKTRVVTYFTRPYFEDPAPKLVATLGQAVVTASEVGDLHFMSIAMVTEVSLAALAGQPLEGIAATAKRHAESCTRAGQFSHGEELRIIHDAFAVATTSDARAAVLDSGAVGSRALRPPALGPLHSTVSPPSHDAFDSLVKRCDAFPEHAQQAFADVHFTATLVLLPEGYRDHLYRWWDHLWPRFDDYALSSPYRCDAELICVILAAERAQRAKVKQHIASISKFDKATRGRQSYLVEFAKAELARLSRDFASANEHYARSAEHAETMGRVPWSALAHLRRAEMLESLGRRGEALLYFAQARNGYLRWGHRRKVASLEAEHPTLRAPERERNDARSRSSRSLATQHQVGNEVDLETILEVANQIGHQRESADVIRAVLLGVAQNAGADRAVLLRSVDERLHVVAELRDGEVRAHQEPLDTFGALAAGTVRKVQRTRTATVLVDAQSDEQTRNDPYVHRSGVRSLLVVPLTNQGKSVGLVVLENHILAGAFTEGRVRLVSALATQAAISLENAELYEEMEARIKARTAEIAARTEAMRLVLDNVDQGLVAVNLTGQLLGESSARFKAWFPAAPQTLIELVSELSPAQATWFELGWDALHDGMMPLELCLAQLPSRIRSASGKTYQFRYQPVALNGEVHRILIIITDITSEVAREIAEARQRDFMALTDRAARDRVSVVEFHREGKELMSHLSTRADGPSEKRWIHTLKGNAALMEQTRLVQACNRIETAADADKRPFSDAEFEQIRTIWSDINATLERLVGADEGTVRISRAEYDHVLSQLREESHDLAEQIAHWVHEPLAARFRRIGESAVQLAQRLRKPAPQIEIEANDLDLPVESWSAFWSAFVHVVRNAVDHGLEDGEERIASGKDPEGRLRFEASRDTERLVISLSDDGRGIDWDRVATKAGRLGLSNRTRDDLVAALLSDGFSTREEATEISGRGVGLAALSQATAQLGGHIEVRSERGMGTTFQFRFPARASGSDSGPSAARLEIQTSPIEIQSSPIEIQTSPIEIQSSPIEIQTSPIDSQRPSEIGSLLPH